MFSFYVDKEKQRQGIGAVLWGRMLCSDISHERSRLNLMVADNFSQAIEFYERNGFNPTVKVTQQIPTTEDADLTINYWRIQKILKCDIKP